jgi:LPS export ABC transporter permease LptG/LPS export ABC transporter permease LptF
MRILDRYLIRETLGPFALGLVLFTFLIAIQPMLSTAETLISKGTPLPTVGYLLLTLLPHALGLTIPMAFLAGVVMALGRLSGDREAVALLACGVSPLRLLRPVVLLASVAAGATLWILISVMPDANQTFVETVYQLTQKMAAQDIKPRMFYEGFTGKVILIEDRAPSGDWKNVLVADTTQPGRPVVQLATGGRLVVDDTNRLVNIVLSRVSGYKPLEDDGAYQLQQAGESVTQIDPGKVFETKGPDRDLNAMTLAQLDEAAATKVAAGLSPHNEIMFKQQRFAFPVACLVFALIGLALGLHTRKEGKLGGFVIGIAVIMAYYGIMAIFEGRAKAGQFPAFWARWMPNVVLGVVGIGLIVWRMTGTRRGLEVRLPSSLVSRLPVAVQKWLPGSAPGQDGRAGALPMSNRAGSPVILVIRIPHFGLWRPRLIDLYVAGRYLRTVSLAFFGLLSLYYIVEFVDMSEKIQKGNATMAMVMEYFYYATPTFAYFVVPLAILVAVLTTFGGLTRTNELTVMRACGVSLYRVAIPVLLFASIWSGMLFVLEDRVLAHTQRRAEALKDVIRDRPQRTFNIANKNWLNGRDGRKYYYSVYDVRNKTLFQLSVFDIARDPYRMREHTYASQVVFRDGQWVATDGWVQAFATNGRVRRTAFDEKILTLEDPKDFGTEQVEASMMNYTELSDYVTRLSESGFSIAEHQVELHRKVAFPFVTLVMTLIAVPFGVTTGRRGALYGIGLALVLAVSYLLATTIFIAFGAAALLPPALAAWAPNILFAAGALTLVLTVRT